MYKKTLEVAAKEMLLQKRLRNELYAGTTIETCNSEAKKLQAKEKVSARLGLSRCKACWEVGMYCMIWHNIRGEGVRNPRDSAPKACIQFQVKRAATSREGVRVLKPGACQGNGA